MAEGKATATYSIMIKASVEVEIHISASSFEHALEKARQIKTTDLLVNKEIAYNRAESEILGVFK